MKFLGLIYTALLLDVFTGLNFNIYGWGREPMWFALGVVAAASLMYRFKDAVLAMIALVLCGAWLLLYPAKNGFDVVLSPTLCLGLSLRLWQKYTTKK